MTIRWIMMLLAVAVLAFLLVWQEQRMALVNACAEQGGIWDGSISECRPAPTRILIEKDLKRS